MGEGPEPTRSWQALAVDIDERLDDEIIGGMASTIVGAERIGDADGPGTLRLYLHGDLDPDAVRAHARSKDYVGVDFVRECLGQVQQPQQDENRS